jgi:branched-chain amino acid aminotransferase
METALLNYFVLNNEIRSTCDFNPYPLKNGLSIYEVLRVSEGVLLFLDEHVERFFRSAALEKIALPFTAETVKKRLKALLSYNHIDQGNVKFLYHIDPDGNTRFMAWLMPFFYPSGEQYDEGVTLGIMNAERPRPNAKKALYSLREKADEMIRRENYYEVLYTSNGVITEGSRSNVFFIKDDVFYTPESSLVLEGITRMKVIQLIGEKGFVLKEQVITLSQIEHFDACFLTGTSPNILPVKKLNQTSFSVHHEGMRQLMDAYHQLMTAYIKSNKKEPAAG